MITFITSLYRSDRYLSFYKKKLDIFAEHLKDKMIDFEIIIIANDPTIKERELGELFKNESWFRYIPVPREPLYVSWNRGVEMAKGDILGFWNVDDVRTPDAIVDGVNIISDGAEFVYFPFEIRWYFNFYNISILAKRKHIDCLKLDRKECQRSMPFASFWIASKELFKKVGPFDEQFRIVADFDWTVRAARLSDKLVRSEISAGIFRVDGNGLSSGGKSVHYAENNVVFRRHGINDKILRGYEETENNYRVNEIKINREYVKYNF